MIKKAISVLSILCFSCFGTFTGIKAADEPAIWLSVTADGVPGSAPTPNSIKAKGKDTKISKNKCKTNSGKALGAIAGGIFGASRGKSNKDKIIGAAAGAGIGLAAGAPIDGCWRPNKYLTSY